MKNRFIKWISCIFVCVLFSFSSLNVYADEALSMDVAYDEITCGNEETFTVQASGGSGNYKYLLNSVNDDYGLVIDPSNQLYQESNTFTFTFMASGHYTLRFYVMDMGSTPYTTVRKDIEITVSDDQYPDIPAIVNEVASSCLQSYSTDYDKALYLHDWILNQCSYDYSYTYCGAEGALARGKGTCEAYHRAYELLLDAVGIEHGRMVGNGHVWTAVKMDGQWYQVDPTWDDIGYSETFTGESHLYFGINDSIMTLVHSDHSVQAGYESNSLADNYFIKEGLIDTYTTPFINSIQQHIDQKETSFTCAVSGFAQEGYNNVIYNLVAYKLSTLSFVSGKDTVVLNVSYANSTLSFEVTYSSGQEDTYTVVYDGNEADSGAVASQSGNEVILSNNTFKKKGYVFDGWMDDAGNSYKEGQSVSLSYNLELKAIWKPVEYTVSFDGNGATGSMESISMVYDQNKTLPDCTFINDQEFEGWNTKADGTGKKYSNKETVLNLSYDQGSNIILYAQWSKPVISSYTIYYKGNGADRNYTGDYSVDYPSSATTTFTNSFVRSGYTFVEYNTKADGTGDSYYLNEAVSHCFGSSETITLYAIWKQDVNSEYTVTLNANGGTCSHTSIKVKNGSSYSALGSVVVSRNGYNFKGWKAQDGTIVDAATTVSSSYGTTLTAMWECTTCMYIPELKSVTNASTGVTVKWNAVEGATKYAVYRKKADGEWSKYLTKTVTSTSYTDTTAVSGTSYFYTVKAYVGKKWYSYDALGLSIEYLSQPVLKTPANAYGGMQVKWNAVNGATGYRVYRKLTGAKKWTLLSETDNNSYLDTSVENGQDYTYTIRAFDDSISSYDKTGKSYTYVSAPELRSAKKYSKGGNLVKWYKVAGATKYAVYRKTKTGSWQRLTNTCTNTYFVDKSADSNTTYIYTVRAYNTVWSGYDSAGKVCE